MGANADVLATPALFARIHQRVRATELVDILQSKSLTST
jgi:hypothetical protein